jgi:tetratricopeptide (TPR) repeat protein
MLALGVHAEAASRPTIELPLAWFAIGEYDGRFGDKSQRLVSLPHAWEVTNPGATGDGWYTLMWTLDTLPTMPQALCMTALTVPTEVYLNGELVAASGPLDGRSPRSYEQSRYIDIPAGLLRIGTNYVGVHVRARNPDVAGLGPVLTGEAQPLRERAREVLFVHTIAPAAISIATLTVGIFIFVLWLRRRESGYALFAAAVVLWSLHTLASLAPDPLLPQPHWVVIWTAAYLMFVAMLCLFCIRFAGVRWPMYERFVLVYAVATVPTLYVAQALGQLGSASSWVRLGGIAIVLAALVAVARYAIRRWNMESALLLVAGTISAVFALHDWLAAQDPLALRPVWLVPYAALAFLTLFGYLLTDRFVRALNESERLNVDLAVPPDDRRPPPVRALLALACALFSTAAMSKTPGDYSERLDALWNFDQPVASEARFRAEAARHPAGSREASEAATQQARALGLQRRFDDADRALEAIVGALARLPARVRVRYLLERGRRDNSSGNRRSAFAWFEQALAASSDDVLPGADYYRVDALHMLAIAAPPERQLEWNRKALAAADAARDARARGWRASLLHNLGWTMHERGDYAAALAYWQQALAAREASHDLARTRIARWTVARGLRSLGRLDEAEAMQRSLAEELQAAGAPDGYVFEELAEIALARGDRAAARPFASKAFALLSQDADLRATEPERLARLSELAR